MGPADAMHKTMRETFGCFKDNCDCPEDSCSGEYLLEGTEDYDELDDEVGLLVLDYGNPDMTLRAARILQEDIVDRIMEGE